MINWLFNNWAKILLIIIICAAFLLLFSEGLARHEVMECKRWIEYEKLYEGFYWTDWQKAQCVAHGF